MPKAKRTPIEPTHDWAVIQTRIEWPEQELYEIFRPLVLFGASPLVRAAETGVPARTLYRRVSRFEAEGMRSLFPPTQPAAQPDDLRVLPRPIQQAIVDLKAQYDAFRPHEIATICFVRFGRRPSPHTVQRVLAAGPPPSRTERRYPPYHAMHGPEARRFAVVQLHSEGWNVKTIAAYLETTRPTVHAILKRWVAEHVLTEKSRARPDEVRKVDLAAMQAVRKLQENPELGEFRVYAALKQMGVDLSPRTCGRILALNRKLYGLPKPDQILKEKKEHPFKAARRHQYWTVDIRYIEEHLVGSKPVYVISILENFSRAILASTIAPTQDQLVYLRVLYEAIRQHGIPEALVSDGGGVFRATQATAVYQALGIRKERIAPRQAWQSYIETQFNVQRRMADYYFAKAATWAELRAVHAKWMHDFNHQPHWAHRHREDGRRSPVEVLDGARGPLRADAELNRVFYKIRHIRRLTRLGYIRFRHWRFYAEAGLAGQPVTVWVCKESLTVEYGEEPLAQYQVEYQPDAKRFRAVTHEQLFATRYASPQRWLWPAGAIVWHLAQREPDYWRRSRRPPTARQLELFPLEETAPDQPAGAKTERRCCAT
jgi:hypothetical protein